MNTLTLNIPDELVAEAKAVGVYDEASILQAFKNFIQSYQIKPKSKPMQRQLGGAEGLVTYMADDFDEPLEDFKDYM